jgi:hypothetical protein
VRGKWRGESFTGDPGAHVEKALEMGISIGALLGTSKWAHLSRTVRDE